jgi:hypothetical protein
MVLIELCIDLPVFGASFDRLVSVYKCRKFALPVET